MPDFTAAESLNRRRLMVDGQIRTFGVTDLDLIDRFLVVPREQFVDSSQQVLALSDAHITLPGSPPRAMLRPMVLAKMLQAAEIGVVDRMLDIAGGLGYTCAIVAGLAKSVVALESVAERTSACRANCSSLGLQNIEYVTAPLADGVPDVGTGSPAGSFDVIFINGAIETVPTELLRQLNDGGRLVTIRTRPGNAVAEAVRFERHGNSIGERVLFETFSPVLEGFVAASEFAF